MRGIGFVGAGEEEEGVKGTCKLPKVVQAKMMGPSTR